jgi:hypothetical protein
MRIKKTASFNVKEGVKSVRYSDLNSGIQYLPADGIINIKSEKVRIAGFGVNESSLYKIDVNGTPYSIGSANSIYLSNAGITTSRSIGGSKGTLSWAMAISDKFGVTVDGTLYAMGGHFAGTIEAKSGKIGTTLINEDGSIVSANGGFRLDANGDLTISHVGGSQLVQDAQTALSTANDAKDKIENAANSINSIAKDLNDLSIGGRNLIRNSKFTSTSWRSNNGIDIINTNGSQFTYTTDGIRTVKANGWGGTGIYIETDITPIEYEKTVTLSFDLKIIKDNDLTFFAYSNTTGDPAWWTRLIPYTSVGMDTAKSDLNNWHRVSCTIKIPAKNSLYEECRVVLIRLRSHQDDNDYEYYMKNLKLELGDKATDWSPAPEDVENDIAQVDKKAEDNKYYRVIEAAANSSDYPGTGFWFKVNGKPGSMSVSRGLNVISINPVSLAVEGAWGFDTYVGGTNNTNFNNKIAELNKGDHIIVVLSYDASYPCNVADALRSIGGTVYSSSKDPYRESYALIGRSNLGFGNGVERYNPNPARKGWQAIVSCRVSENGALMSFNSGSLGEYAQDVQIKVGEIEKWKTNNDIDNKLNHASTLINKWTDNAQNDDVKINGAWIKANTITADKIALGDFTNYCQLSKDNTWGSAYSDHEEYNGSTYVGYMFTSFSRDNVVSDQFPCKKGDTFRVSCKIKCQIKADDPNGNHIGNVFPQISIFTKKADGSNSGWYIPRSHSIAYDTYGQAEVSEVITLTLDSDCFFRVYFQIDAYKNFSGWFTVIDPVVRKMSDGEMIVSGSITGDHIAAKTIRADNIAAHAINVDLLADNSISNSKLQDTNYGTSNSWINLKRGTMNLGGKLKWDGSTLNINGNGSFSGNISADTGNIGGWVIESNGIYQRNAFGNVSVTTGVGGIDAIGTSDVDFLRVQKSDGTYPFYVHKDGTMYCSNAEIEGTIRARNGKIGNFYISDGNLTGGANTNIYWNGDGAFGSIESKASTMANTSGITGQDSRGMIIAGYLGSTLDIGIRRDSDNSTDSGKWDSAIHINGVSTVIRNPTGAEGTISSYIVLGNGFIIIDPNHFNDYTNSKIIMHGPVYADDPLDGNNDLLLNGNNLSRANIYEDSVGPYVTLMFGDVDSVYGVRAWLSDAKYKNSILDTTVNATSIIRRLAFRQFNWNSNGQHTKIGLVAQELKKIDSDLVTEIRQPDGSLTYQINDVTMAMITAKATQETISRIDKLESSINSKIFQNKNELESKLMIENQKLKDRLDYLEAKIKYINGEKSSYSEG